MHPYPVLIHHVANYDQLAILVAVINHGHSADFYVSVERHRDS